MGKSESVLKAHQNNGILITVTYIIAVTGAVVVNRVCGGQVYVEKNMPLADNCYVISRQEDSRINTTRCYCSSSYCNTAATVDTPPYFAVLLPLLFTIGYSLPTRITS